MLSAVEHLVDHTWKKSGGQDKFQQEGESEDKWVRHRVVHILVEIVGFGVFET